MQIYIPNYNKVDLVLQSSMIRSRLFTIESE